MENEFQTWLNQIGAKGRFLQRGKKVGKSSPYFNNAIVEQSPVRNYLDMNLDSKLLFTEYINGKKMKLWEKTNLLKRFVSRTRTWMFSLNKKLQYLLLVGYNNITFFYVKFVSNSGNLSICLGHRISNSYI